jgi:V-type H+-transporting ATPase subunit a
MTFAICLQVPNHLHFKRPFNIYAEFIPQILFLQSIFGYLVVCIILKWTIDWSKASTQPPGLLNMLIYMFLSPGSVKAEERLFPGQSILQILLLLVALVCVPWMLCVKPYMAWKEMKGHEGDGYGRLGLGDDVNGELIAEEEGDGQLVAEQIEEQEEVSILVCVSIHTLD